MRKSAIVALLSVWISGVIFGLAIGAYEGYKRGSKHGAMGAQMQCLP